MDNDPSNKAIDKIDFSKMVEKAQTNLNDSYRHYKEAPNPLAQEFVKIKLNCPSSNTTADFDFIVSHTMNTCSSSISDLREHLAHTDPRSTRLAEKCRSQSGRMFHIRGHYRRQQIGRYRGRSSYSTRTPAAEVSHSIALLLR